MMRTRRAHQPSRRTALAALAALVWSRTPVSHASQEDCSRHVDAIEPAFSPSGPDAERYGSTQGYPRADPTLPRIPGDPQDLRYRVGAYTHVDENFATRRIARASAAWCHRYASRERSDDERRAIDALAGYLSRHPVTGLLVAKDEEILFEHYQYGRTDRDLFYSGSMSKSIVALLVGIAIDDGAIRSIDDAAEVYVPGLVGTAYGRTPIRDPLHMSSGVAFDEDGGDLDRLWIDSGAGDGVHRKGTVASIAQFDRRVVPPGRRFAYASVEPDVLALVLREATGRSVSRYLEERIWRAIGTESDATWLVDADGHEVAHSFFSATLRDYARLGRLLAHDGDWNGRLLVSAAWLRDATSHAPSQSIPAAQQRNPHAFGYGYLFWLLPGGRRQFAAIGSNGQTLCIDPQSKIVLVQTAVEANDEVWPLWNMVVDRFGS